MKVAAIVVRRSCCSRAAGASAQGINDTAQSASMVLGRPTRSIDVEAGAEFLRGIPM